jgi:predicted metal-dependent RNase
MARYKVSDHFDGKKFYNLTSTHNESLYTVIKWKLTSKRIKWPKWIHDESVSLTTKTIDDKSVCTWVGHACFLIQLDGMNILTDPVYADRASPVQFAGPKRVRAQGIEWDSLPRIDLVLISHNHYDHLDLETLEKLEKRDAPHFMVALGDKKLLESRGIKSVGERTSGLVSQSLGKFYDL